MNAQEGDRAVAQGGAESLGEMPVWEERGVRKRGNGPRAGHLQPVGPKGKGRK